MSQADDIRPGDVISAWKKNGSFNAGDSMYVRVVQITPTEIMTVLSLAACQLSPASGQSRLRVCARRVRGGAHVLDPLPRIFQIDVNDGTVDGRLERGMDIVSTMLLVQGENNRWQMLADAAAEARATEHKAHVDGSAFAEADDDGNYPADMFLRIHNCCEEAVKYAIEEIGGTYEAIMVPPDTPNDDVGAFVSNERATWRSKCSTLLSREPALVSDGHDDDDDEAEARFQSLMPLAQQQELHAKQDEEQQQEREQQQQRFAVE